MDDGEVRVYMGRLEKIKDNVKKGDMIWKII